MAEERLEDAKVLLGAGRWTAAFYLAGYAVECGLKSCVLQRVINEGTIFIDHKFAEKCWTHDLAILVKQAGLDPELGKACQAEPLLQTNWDIVKDWKETARYEAKVESAAKTLVDAVGDPQSGMLQWIRRHW